MTDDLRAALESAMVGMTEEQAHAARELLDTLTPPMDEPTWPGAPVIAACGGARRRLHTRQNDGPHSGWECDYSCTCTEWDQLVNPRPLTPAEYAEHGIPEPCEHAADGETVERAIAAACEATGVDVSRFPITGVDLVYMRAALVAVGFTTEYGQ